MTAAPPRDHAGPPARPLDEYLELPYHVTLERGEDSAWVAKVEELAGCLSAGATPEEAASGVRPAMAEWIRAAQEEGREVPEPVTATHSGRLLLRMPRTLHAELARQAEREGVSLNQLITGALATAVGWRGVPGDTRAGAAGASEPGDDGRPTGGRIPSRYLLPALAANVVLLGLLALLAIAILVVALTTGF